MKKRTKTSGMYNPIESLRENIEIIKKGEDWMAVAYALGEVKDIHNEIREFEKLRRLKLYKERIVESLHQLKEIIQKRSFQLEKKHDAWFDQQNEMDWHEQNKKHLKLLQEEAKRLKL